MSFQKGDIVKYKRGEGPEKLSDNTYVVLEYFINYAKQKTVRCEDLATGAEEYKDPDLLELVK